jgi:hypothetical protein
LEIKEYLGVRKKNQENHQETPDQATGSKKNLLEKKS